MKAALKRGDTSVHLYPRAFLKEAGIGQCDGNIFI